MARQLLTKLVPVGPYPALPVVANSLDLPFTAANATDKEHFIPGNDSLLIVKNDHATLAKTFIITSKANEMNRTGDVGPYSLGAGEHAVFRLKKSGWMQSDGKIRIEAESSDIKFAVIQL
jgi:hypothetical protein